MGAARVAGGRVEGYVFGFVLNLSFWPFSVDPASSIGYRPGLSFVAELHCYLLFGATRRQPVAVAVPRGPGFMIGETSPGFTGSLFIAGKVHRS
ncbi:MAG TPA: hypothetical protein VFQ44_18925 [Streptosporangiaceae bacterium]|nr:hypothetical protein [Streptosporangiaceae bacterium]